MKSSIQCRRFSEEMRLNAFHRGNTLLQTSASLTTSAKPREEFCAIDFLLIKGWAVNMAAACPFMDIQHG